MGEVVIRKRGGRRRDWCKHYNGTVNKTCRAEVAYDSVKIEHDPVFYHYEGDRTDSAPYAQRVSLPCFREENPAGAVCDKCEFMTKEEADAYDAAIQKRMEGTGQARAAIVASLGGPWKRGVGGSAGEIDCPVCGAAKTLRFTRSGYNGHIHAACKTEGCVSWME